MISQNTWDNDKWFLFRKKDPKKERKVGAQNGDSTNEEAYERWK